jgi:hypothetical protein
MSIRESCERASLVFCVIGHNPSGLSIKLYSKHTQAGKESGQVQ